MNPLTAVLASTNRWFVIVGTIVSFVLGAIRYNKHLFGTQYGKWLGMQPTDSKSNMGRLFVLEIVSRVLFFIGVGQAFYATGRESLGNGLVLMVVVRLLFVFPTQLSQATRSTANIKIVRLIGGKVLVEMLLAAVLRYGVFSS